MSDEPAGNGEAAGATKPSDDRVSDGAGAEPTKKDEFSETPASFSPGPAFFSSPAGSMLVATETASAAETPVTAVTAGEAEASAPKAESPETERAPAPAATASSEAASDAWDDRQLCVDGGCVGVLDETGACRVCGKVDPDFQAPASRPAAASANDEDDEDDDGERAHGENGSSSSGGDGDEWDDRKLCEDGACIGVVIAGRCNTCGRAG